MDKVNIEGVILSPLMKISHPKGDIFHGIKKSDNGYVGFGEVYFSMIKCDEIKGWNRHKMMTMNLVVPIGKVTFIIYDDRQRSSSKGSFNKIELSPDNYQRLTIPPGLWCAFKGKSSGTNLIMDLVDIEHDPNEIERQHLNQFSYDLKSA